MRFIYCACCVCYILKDWSCMDVDKAVEFIKRSQVERGEEEMGRKRWGGRDGEEGIGGVIMDLIAI